MSSAKNTSGQRPLCSRAPISVPTAPASSGFTASQPAAANPGVDISAPPCGASALLCTSHPPSPTGTVLASADGADPAACTQSAHISRARVERAAPRRIGAGSPSPLSDPALTRRRLALGAHTVERLRVGSRQMSDRLGSLERRQVLVHAAHPVLGDLVGLHREARLHRCQTLWHGNSQVLEHAAH